MTAVDQWILELEQNQVSLAPQPLVSTVATAIAALQLLAAGAGGTVQAANTFFAGPPSGVPALPTFRAPVTADLPTTFLASIGNLNLNSTTKPNQGLFSPAALQLGVGINALEVMRFVAGGFQVGNGIGASAVFNDYEVGTWTPVDNSGAGLSFGSIVAGWTRIANIVHAYCSFNFAVTANGNQASIGGLPFTVANNLASLGQHGATFASGQTPTFAFLSPNTTAFGFEGNTGTVLANAALTGATIRSHLIYPIT